ncbi:FAD/FMN-containing dehydrogenase [Murinocardiopsis flavida]|uniref:FAD/FMN-containing dehydrogenase n=1 Tax=Murinocardiopsis flavida TaxID=645275 RepID=A0A2P8DP38_9ACTN|nr:FAD-binding protein [Murinocardiopsis flavida]PSK98971.1 FAD/FMN-containing dehydrogenase [Murinocardiopsis flavida]
MTHQDTAAGIDRLRADVRGAVLVPGDPAYASHTTGFNTAVVHRPAVVVAARTPADVANAVAHAAAHGLAAGVQATGHGAAQAAAGGVLVSTRAMDGVRVDAGRRRAVVGAGARWSQVIEAAAEHGLAPLSGSAPHVGAVGYTLGGGLSLLARRHGYAADHVHAMDVVTAQGREHRVDADTDPELMWGLLGGRDNLAIVTGMEIGLVELPAFTGGGLYLDAADPAAVLAGWAKWTREVPEELTTSIALLTFPDVAGLPEPLRGRRAAHVRVCHTGPEEEARRLVEPLRGLAPVVMDTVAAMPYTASGTIHGDPAEPMAYTGDNALLDGVDGAVAGAVADAVGPGAAAPAIVEVRHLGGALERRPGGDTAVGHRGARFLVSSAGMLGTADDAGVRAAQRRLMAALEPRTVGRFLSFLGPDAGPERVADAYEAHDLARLRALKAARDPGTVFRMGHTLAPAAARG